MLTHRTLHILSIPHLSIPQLSTPHLSIPQLYTKGGRVKEVHGTHRVYLASDDVPGLAMSRSLGDYVAHSAGTYIEGQWTEYVSEALQQPMPLSLSYSPHVFSLSVTVPPSLSFPHRPSLTVFPSLTVPQASHRSLRSSNMISLRCTPQRRRTPRQRPATPRPWVRLWTAVMRRPED